MECEEDGYWRNEIWSGGLKRGSEAGKMKWDKKNVEVKRGGKVEMQ